MITKKSFIASIKKTKAGNYFGYYRGYYIFIRRRPHAGWHYMIGRKGKWIASDGYHTQSMMTLKIAKQNILFVINEKLSKW